MKVFVDANILVAVLNKEYPNFTYAARILSLADLPQFQVFTSPLCLAIAFYFSSKKSGRKIAKKKVALLAQKLSFVLVNNSCITCALNNPKINDLEDGFQYYAALEKECSCIITEDLNDFYFSDIEVINSENFLEKYVFN